MHITHLSLTNFRNYGRLELDLTPEAILLQGPNAQGKTNLLEAIYYLATTRSPHADSDQQIINWEADGLEEPLTVARITATLATAEGETLVEMRLIKERRGGSSSFRREALVNRRKVRLMDLLGHLRAVLFLPSDMQLITGPPAERRRYLDITLCQTDRVYCRTLSRYNKVLEQRNATLRQIAEFGQGHEVLALFDEQLVELAAQIFVRRATFMDELAREAHRVHYEHLTDRQETLRMSYLPRLRQLTAKRGDATAVENMAQDAAWIVDQGAIKPVAETFAQTLQSSRERDLASGSTRVGPHRDDWTFWVNGRSLSSYGSRGQQRSGMLALKIAEINRIEKETGEFPILLLDEVVAELDATRRALLLAYVQNGAQAILTATDPNMFTPEFLAEATVLRVTNGQIDREETPAL